MTPPVHLLHPAPEMSLLRYDWTLTLQDGYKHTFLLEEEKSFNKCPYPLTCLSLFQSVLRLSHSQPSSPPAGPYHPTLTPIQTPAAFSLDQTIFNLPGDDR